MGWWTHLARPCLTSKIHTNKWSNITTCRWQLVKRKVLEGQFDQEVEVSAKYKNIHFRRPLNSTLKTISWKSYYPEGKITPITWWNLHLTHFDIFVSPQYNDWIVPARMSPCQHFPNQPNYTRMWLFPKISMTSP